MTRHLRYFCKRRLPFELTFDLEIKVNIFQERNFLPKGNFKEKIYSAVIRESLIPRPYILAHQ
jgi:hypothetical protein